MYKKTGKLIPLSVQNLVDCSKSHGNHGCDWGNTYYAFLSVWINGGLEAEATYPYEGKVSGPHMLSVHLNVARDNCRYDTLSSALRLDGRISLSSLISVIKYRPLHIFLV